MPAPYATNCFDYSKIGCQSKSECIDQCKVEINLRECDVLPSFVNMDKSNDRDKYEASDCKESIEKSICEGRFTSNDCFMEHYTLKTVINDEIRKHDEKAEFLSKHYPQYNSNLVTSIDIVFHDDPDTIYSHSPQQHFVEFACYAGGVIALWTGFSIMSLYGYGKTFLINNFSHFNKSNQRRSTNSRGSLFKNYSKINKIADNSNNYNQRLHFNQNIFSTFPTQKTVFS